MFFILVGFFIGLYIVQDLTGEKKLNCFDKKEIHDWKTEKGKTICTKCGHIWGE